MGSVIALRCVASIWLLGAVIAFFVFKPILQYRPEDMETALGKIVFYGMIALWPLTLIAMYIENRKPS